jgi:hypothetical protein
VGNSEITTSSDGAEISNCSKPLFLPLQLQKPIVESLFSNFLPDTFNYSCRLGAFLCGARFIALGEAEVRVWEGNVMFVSLHYLAERQRALVYINCCADHTVLLGH